jgi:hypothetical protein
MRPDVRARDVQWAILRVTPKFEEVTVPRAAWSRILGEWPDPGGVGETGRLSFRYADTLVRAMP